MDESAGTDVLLTCAGCGRQLTGGDAARCPRCGVVHHAPCWTAAGGCGGGGCGHRATPSRIAATPATSAVVTTPEPEPQREVTMAIGHRSRPRRRLVAGLLVAAFVVLPLLAIVATRAGWLEPITGPVVVGSELQRAEEAARTAGYRAGNARAVETSFAAGWDAGCRAVFDRLSATTVVDANDIAVPSPLAFTKVMCGEGSEPATVLTGSTTHR